MNMHANGERRSEWNGRRHLSSRLSNSRSYIRALGQSILKQYISFYKKKKFHIPGFQLRPGFIQTVVIWGIDFMLRTY